MGFFGRMLGMENGGQSDAQPAAPSMARPGASNAEAGALERYRYMLRTAPPETLEQAHAEAFEKLSPDQRRQILSELAQCASPSERASIAATPLDNPRALARVATRAEVRDPGVLERSLGSGALGFGANLLTSLAAGFAGSMVAQAFFSTVDGFGGDAAGEAEMTDGAFADASPDGGGNLEDEANWADEYDV